jgi:hypothetical protein
VVSDYTSDELFHFVGHASPTDDNENFGKLRNILDSNCISHSPHDASWGKISHETRWDNRLETEQLIVPSVTCYADIPFEALSTHTSKYGKFGVALPRWLLIKYGARPVTYIPMRSDDWQSIYGRSLLRDIEAAVKSFKEQVVENQQQIEPRSRTLDKPRTPEEAIAAIHTILLKDFLAFIKPFNSELPNDHPSNYYMEREWRKYGNMKFEADQVSRILVAKGYKEQTIEKYPVYEDRVFEF